MQTKFAYLSALVLLSCVVAAPAPSGTSSAPESTQTVPYASDDPNDPLWNYKSKIVPQPIRGSLGASLLGPQNIPIELENPDLLAPPSTDNGDV